MQIRFFFQILPVAILSSVLFGCGGAGESIKKNDQI